jgi:T5SS/PEP-CTERM-associated repeat protein
MPRTLFVLAVVCCLAVSPLASGAVIPGGDTALADSPRLPTYVGWNADGTLQINGGSVHVSDTGYLGYSAGATGSVTITGAASHWESRRSFFVGHSGSGSLTIAAGASFYAPQVYLGYNAGAQGDVTIGGTGSKWTSGDVFVGVEGSGSLTVNQGASFSTGDLYASLADLHGNGLITAHGAVLDADVVFDETHGTDQSLSFGGGGTLRFTVDQYHDLGAGYKAGGSLKIADGLQVTSQFGYLGYGVGSNGVATVSGSGSRWQVKEELLVGNNGQGALHVGSGAEAHAKRVYLGYNNGSLGTASVSGAGAKLTVIDGLYVGYGGSGTLTVSEGGLVDTKTFYGSLANLEGNGTIVATSAVVDADVVFDGTHGPHLSLPFGAGGMLQSNFESWSDLGVGYQDVGTLRIAEGSVVGSRFNYLGYCNGAVGEATVSGAGTVWNVTELDVGHEGNGELMVEAGAEIKGNKIHLGRLHGSNGVATVTGPSSKLTLFGNLYVASEGTGTLTVSNGASITAGAICTSLANLHGDGVINVNGIVLDGDLVFDKTHGTTRSLPFGTGGTLNLALNGTGALGVGHSGSGTLRIADGAKIYSGELLLGDNTEGNGVATITGLGSLWANDGLYIGNKGSGTLTVEAGGELRSAWYVYMGFHKGSSGTVIVRGNGSKWNSSEMIIVGSFGRGTLNIESGGLVVSRGGAVGGTLPGESAVTITGAGSRWLNYGGLDIRNGTLRVEASGLVTSTIGWVSGAAWVAGANSKWTNSGELQVSGTISIESGGQVSNTNAFIGPGSLETPTVFVRGMGSQWTNWGSLHVGRDGLGALTIANGGLVTTILPLYVGQNGQGSLQVETGGTMMSASACLGGDEWSRGVAYVADAGSQWKNVGELSLGNSGGTGQLDVANGGQVTASLVSLASGSAVRLHVSGDNMLVLGDASNAGVLVNGGTLALYAGPDLAVGTYEPIAESQGRPMTWASGQIQSLGGIWNPTTYRFTTSALREAVAGASVSIDLTSQQRIRFRDDVSARSLGVSFHARTSALPLNALAPTSAESPVGSFDSPASTSTLLQISATPISDVSRSSIEQLLQAGETLIGGWQFTTTSGYAAGDLVYLSFEAGPGLTRDSFSIWRQSGTSWASYDAVDLTYDGRYASFTVTELHGTGYAVSAVPEPGTLALLAACALAFGSLVWSRKRR